MDNIANDFTECDLKHFIQIQRGEDEMKWIYNIIFNYQEYYKVIHMVTN